MVVYVVAVKIGIIKRRAPDQNRPLRSAGVLCTQHVENISLHRINNKKLFAIAHSYLST